MALRIVEGFGGPADRPTERPRQDSNLRTRLRRPMLYPLSYEGMRKGPGNSNIARLVPGQRSEMTAAIHIGDGD